MNKQKQNYRWGLYGGGNTLPLKKLDISVLIDANVAEVKYSQIYINNTDKTLDLEFFFPVSPEATFNSFEAAFDGEVIKGVIKKKEEAQEEFKQAV